MPAPVRTAAVGLLALTAAGLPVLTGPAHALSPDVVISEVYGGGGNSGAPFNADYIELYNRGSAPVQLDGLSLQYASATGTGFLGASSGQATDLPSALLAPGGYFLVAMAAGASGSPLPTPDFVDPTPIAMAAGAGKVALATGNDSLGCNTAASCAAAGSASRIVDLVGYGGANYFEGAAPAPTLSNTTAAQRKGDGATETDENGSDFAAVAPDPDNSGSSTPPPPPPPPPANDRLIREIQAASHVSPLAGVDVTGVPGVVTALRSNGFYLQDPTTDGDDATSEGLFVFTGSTPTVAVGDSLRVAGRVSEFRPGGSGSTNLSTTQIGSPTITTLSTGNPLPAATVVGTGGRVPPTAVIDDDAAGSVETSGSFDATTDGIDFYESLEGMRLAIDDAVAVGPTSGFGELPVVSAGSGAGLRTPRGGINVQPGDFNPERILLDDGLTGGGASPAADTGDVLGPVDGVLDYSFGNYKLLLRATPTLSPAGLVRETTAPKPAGQLSIATYNVENLDPGDGPAKFAAVAHQIVTNLRAPDVLSLEEVQDDNGPTNDGTVTDDVTLDTLVAAIQAAGGPTYDHRSIDPANGTNGGEPGGNIRNAFLFRTDTGVDFVDRPGGTATTPVTVAQTSTGPQLSVSPGLVDPTNPAFASSRKPLAGEFTYAGKTFFLVSNHFNSKGGDQPLFGRFQPPARSSEVQRRQQATIVGDFVEALQVADPQVLASVLGDINDFQFSEVAGVLEAAGLEVLLERLPLAEQYTYVFEGNSQVLDQILATAGLGARMTSVDVVHVNAEYADQVSDHDPVIVTVDLVDPPVADPAAPPTIDDTTPIIGQVLTAAPGRFAGSPAMTDYQWLRCSTKGCLPIAGATASTYTVAQEDKELRLAVTVTATNAAGSDSATSAPTELVRKKAKKDTLG